MKTFTNQRWNEVLESQDWSQIYKESDVDKKVEIFTDIITSSLDEIAPFCAITIRSNHKFGLSDNTKDLMKKREAARLKIKKSVGNEKLIWNTKYKKIRNKVNAQIKKETINFNK